MLKDTEVTAEHQKKYSLLLIGGADANRVTQRLGARVPLQVKRDSVTIDGRKFSATDAVVQLVYPSPAQPDRYVLIVAATSPAGMHFWNPSAFRHLVYGFPLLPMDWTLRDGRRVKLDNGLSAERMWIASGTFDNRWRRDDRWVFSGDESLRAQSPLRQAPASTATAPPANGHAYVGTYRFEAGFTAAVAEDGNCPACRNLR
jgi:hypothetical protein